MIYNAEDSSNQHGKDTLYAQLIFCDTQWCHLAQILHLEGEEYAYFLGDKLMLFLS